MKTESRLLAYQKPKMSSINPKSIRVNGKTPWEALRDREPVAIPEGSYILSHDVLTNPETRKEAGV